MIAGLIPLMTYAICLMFMSPLLSLAVTLPTLFICAFVTNAMIRTPFTPMLEGEGLLGMTLDSSGIINFFLFKINMPQIKGNLNGKEITDVFDQEAIHRLANPIIAKEKVEVKDGKIKLEFDTGEYNTARFGFSQYPVLIFNKAIGSIITKDFLSNKEKSFNEHQILYLNEEMKKMNNLLFHFSRSVIDQLKGSLSFLQGSWWIWVIVAFGVAILLWNFAPQLIASIKGATGGVMTNATTQAAAALNSGAGFVPK